MKRLLLIFFFLLNAAGLASAGNAVTIWAGVSVGGTINVGTPVYNSLNPTAGAVNVLVTTVNERCNSKAGYQVTLTSLNAAGSSQAVLKSNDSANADRVNYSLTYDNVNVTLVDGSAVVTDSNRKAPGNGVDKQVRITIPTVAYDYNADVYSDTLVFTLVAK